MEKRKTVEVVVIKPDQSPGDIPGMGEKGGAIGMMFKAPQMGKNKVRYSAITRFPKTGSYINIEITNEI